MLSYYPRTKVGKIAQLSREFLLKQKVAGQCSASFRGRFLFQKGLACSALRSATISEVAISKQSLLLREIVEDKVLRSEVAISKQSLLLRSIVKLRLSSWSLRLCLRCGYSVVVSWGPSQLVCEASLAFLSWP